MTWIDGIVERWDRVDLSRLLWINAGLALLVLFAHGGAVLLIDVSARPISADEAAAIRGTARITVPIAAVCLMLAVMALIRPAMRTPVLSVHAFAFAGGALALVVWAVLLSVPREAERFTWNPVFFALLVAYPVYLCRRIFFADRIQTVPLVRYAHIVALIVSGVLSAQVIWRMYGADA